jgi:uncharacterized Fe-S radical SAM superfamily protein PflX
MSDKLELKDILGALDCGAKEVWDELTAEQRKSVSFFLLNRYMSSVKTGNRELQEHFVLTVNEYYNKHWNDLQKHPKLLWQLLSMCAHDTKKIMFHEWIAHKKTPANKKTRILEQFYPGKKADELYLMSKLMTDKDVKELCRQYGMSESEIAAKFK